jgi:hypothetical protein
MYLSITVSFLFAALVAGDAVLQQVDGSISPQSITLKV